MLPFEFGPLELCIKEHLGLIEEIAPEMAKHHKLPPTKEARYEWSLVKLKEQNEKRRDSVIEYFAKCEEEKKRAQNSRFQYSSLAYA